MRHIFHTTAESAAELRAELLSDLEKRIKVEESKPTPRSVLERERLAVRINTILEILDFWANVIIDKKEDRQ